jgi:hypothetical protein
MSHAEDVAMCYRRGTDIHIVLCERRYGDSSKKPLSEQCLTQRTLRCVTAGALTFISSSVRDDMGTVVKNHCPSNVSRRGRCDVLPQGH